MTQEVRATYNQILENVAQELDIPPSRFEQARKHYEAVGKYIEDGEYSGAFSKPKIYTQGSFRLGTVVRPIKNGKDSDYDIDLVSELQLYKKSTTPKQLKKYVGDRLSAKGTYSKILEDEGRRCWTLKYAVDDGWGFHLDVLPCCPEDDSIKMDLISRNVSTFLADKAIAITHTDHDGNYFWRASNPDGYAEWFFNRMRSSFNAVESAQRQIIYEANQEIFASVSDVPNPLIKTPLQRAIQILKHHRDQRFISHQWEKEKPISMIITTLSALLYEQESDVVTTLENIVAKLEIHAGLLNPQYVLEASIAKRNIISRLSDGTWYIQNPVNPRENFADRWHENGERRAKAFFQWVKWVKSDLSQLLSQYANVDDIIYSLNESMGSEIVGNAVSSLERSAERNNPKLIRNISKVTRALGQFNVAHKQAPNWRLELTGIVKVEGFVTIRGFRQTKFSSDSQTVPKSASLRFEASTDIRRPFKVYWQVVNTGSEATNAKCLRGEFYDGIIEQGGLARKESTLYSGMHWVECFIIKNGVCVARSGEFVVNIK